MGKEDIAIIDMHSSL